jgi:hypothetical protein
MLTSLIKTLLARPIADPSALRRFLSGEASLLAQRLTYEFSRNTLAWYGQHYFNDKGFNEVFRRCRWESFARLAADMSLLAFARMPEACGEGRSGLEARMAALYAAVLGEYPVPAHRPNGWGDMADAFVQRLAAAQPPVDPEGLTAATSKAIFATLPVFSDNRAGDFDVVRNAVAFGLAAFAGQLRRRVDLDRVGAALRAGAPVDAAREVAVS